MKKGKTFGELEGMRDNKGSVEYRAFWNVVAVFKGYAQPLSYATDCHRIRKVADLLGLRFDDEGNLIGQEDA